MIYIKIKFLLLGGNFKTPPPIGGPQIFYNFLVRKIPFPRPKSNPPTIPLEATLYKLFPPELNFNLYVPSAVARIPIFCVGLAATPVGLTK